MATLSLMQIATPAEIGRCLTLGAVTGLMTLLACGAAQAASRAWSARSGGTMPRLAPWPVAIVATLGSSVLHFVSPEAWSHSSWVIEMGLLAAACALLLVWLLIAVGTRKAGSDELRRRVGRLALASLVIPLVVVGGCSLRGAWEQQRLGAEIALEESARAPFAHALERHRELRDLSGRVVHRIERMAALGRGEAPGPPRRLEHAPAIEPGPITWNPLRQQEAILQRRAILDDLHLEVVRGRSLQGQLAEMEREIANLRLMERDLDEMEEVNVRGSGSEATEAAQR